MTRFKRVFCHISEMADRPVKMPCRLEAASAALSAPTWDMGEFVARNRGQQPSWLEGEDGFNLLASAPSRGVVASTIGCRITDITGLPNAKPKALYKPGRHTNAIG